MKPIEVLTELREIERYVSIDYEVDQLRICVLAGYRRTSLNILCTTGDYSRGWRSVKPSQAEISTIDVEIHDTYRNVQLINDFIS